MQGPGAPEEGGGQGAAEAGRLGGVWLVNGGMISHMQCLGSQDTLHVEKRTLMEGEKASWITPLS